MPCLGVPWVGVACLGEAILNLAFAKLCPSTRSVTTSVRPLSSHSTHFIQFGLLLTKVETLLNASTT